MFKLFWVTNEEYRYRVIRRIGNDDTCKVSELIILTKGWIDQVEFKHSWVIRAL